jgi:hypothetical protein
MKGREMVTAQWKPDYTARAQQIWESFQRSHDLTDKMGMVGAIDPETERVWIGESAVDIARQMQADCIDSPVYLVRVGDRHFLHKGRR